MKTENTRALNLMGFYTEKLESGGTRFFYHDPFTGHVEELTEDEYFRRADEVMRAADLVERISIN